VGTLALNYIGIYRILAPGRLGVLGCEVFMDYWKAMGIQGEAFLEGFRRRLNSMGSMAYAAD
jgi:hypothetical protein